MAAGGGGSWKVAYADFVTAMMAFFLVMWICSQDQKTRDAVAHYFNEPFRFFKDPVGSGRTLDRGGALFESKAAGQVPDSENIELGRGRESHTPRTAPSPATRTVSDWIHADEKTAKYWEERARRAFQMASRSTAALGDASKVEDTAVDVLAEQLQDELGGAISPKGDKEDNGLRDDLLRRTLAEVNWVELAQDLLRHQKIP
jgi:flagellar motor protein MotB